MRAVVILALALAGCGGAMAGAETTPEAAERRECTAALRFEEPATSSTESADPRTEVSLVLICQGEAMRRLAIGTELGACFREEDQASLLRARCWWGGEGASIVVRHEDDALVVRRAAIEDSRIGDHRETGRIDIPDDASVQPL